MESRWEVKVGVVKVCERVLVVCCGVDATGVVNGVVENLLQNWWNLRKRLHYSGENGAFITCKRNRCWFIYAG